MSKLPLSLNRDALKRIGYDQRSIIALEQLFSQVNDGLPNDIDSYSMESGGALANALQALSDIQSKIDSLAQSIQIQEIPSQANPDTLSPVLLPSRNTVGSFCDTTSQTAAAINTAYAITLNTSALADGAYIGATTSRIYVTTAGTYHICAGIQIDKATDDSADVFAWMRKNGTDIANSCRKIAVAGSSADSVLFLSRDEKLAGGDYIEIVWSTTSTDCILTSFAATAVHPVAPSIIVTIEST